MVCLSKPDLKHIGALIAILFAHITLFIMSQFLRQTTLCSEIDGEGIKTSLFYHISALLLSQSKHLKSLQFSGQNGAFFKQNVKATFTFGVILPLFTEEYYEKSVGSLGVALSMGILYLTVLIIINPHSDLGIFDFLLGMASSVAYNLYGFTSGFWIVAAIIYTIYKFKCQLDQIYREPAPLNCWSSCHVEKLVEIVEALMVAGFYVYWDVDLFRSNCQIVGNGPGYSRISCSANSLIGLTMYLVVLVLWFTCVVVPRFCSLIPAELIPLDDPKPEGITDIAGKEDGRKISSEKVAEMEGGSGLWEEEMEKVDERKLDESDHQEEKSVLIKGLVAGSFHVVDTFRSWYKRRGSGKYASMQPGQPPVKAGVCRRFVNRCKFVREQRKQQAKNKGKY